MIPFEYTSRSPRFANWRGKNRSRASSAPSRGKPWNEVFAARTRIANVVIWTTQNMNPNAVPVGKVARASCDTTEAVSLGRACILTVSHDTPRKKVIAMTPRANSVLAAFFACGWRNALTPLEIASTPVSAADPDAKARRSTNKVTAPAPAGSGCGATAWGHVPMPHFTPPTAINTM